MTESKVTVLTPNGRRQIIKVTPNTTILQILEEACKKHGFESESHCLKHHNREVGLTQMFRFSGLPNNCLLEMCETGKRREAEKVEICIQTEDGTRKLGEFESNESVWNVIENLNAEGIKNYENPVAIYMRQEICGKENIQNTTLKALGIIEGRALIRVVNKKPEELKTQANVYKAPTEKEPKKVESGDVAKRTATSGGAGGFAITKELVKSLKKNIETGENAAVAEEPSSDNEKQQEAKAEDVEKKPKFDWGSGTGRSLVTNLASKTDDGLEKMEEMEAEPEMIIIGERNAILYSLNSIQRDIEELPDSFYELTVSDLKLVLRDLKRTANGNEDAPLLTEKLRELEQNKTMLNKIAQYKTCIIRIQFPDRYVLQGVFKPSDTVANIGDFVRKFLRQPNEKFSLFTIPPKTNLQWDKNLLELDLVPNAVVHFCWDVDPVNPEDGLNIIKEEFLTQLTSIEGAIFAANKLRLTHRIRAKTDYYDDDDDRPGPSSGAIPKRPRNDS